MTATEHKAAFRTAVRERIEGLLELKKDALMTIRANDLERNWIARSWTIDVLWEIIDRLVDDLHEIQQKQGLTPDQEAALKAAALKEAAIWNGHYKETPAGTRLVCLCKGCVRLAEFLLDWQEKEESTYVNSL